MSKPQINVTPLIDVLLVLLIIFMVITPTKPSAFDAKIPREPKQDDPVEPNPRTLIISVAPDLALRLNRELLEASVEEPEVLIERLSAIFKVRSQDLVFAENISGEPPRIEKTVFIKAPRGLDYGSVAKVVDAVKTAGASPVSLQIDDLD
jgi:biopolymer transport protein ExbD